jgi:hypothetical protein
MCVTANQFAYLVSLMLLASMAVLIIAGGRLIRQARSQASDPTPFDIPMIWLITGLRRFGDERSMQQARTERDRDLLARTGPKLAGLSLLVSAVAVATMVVITRAC